MSAGLGARGRPLITISGDTMHVARRFGVLTLLALTALEPASAQRLARRAAGTGLTWGAGGFSNMQNAITSAFGGAANIFAVADISSLAALSTSTALYLDLGALSNGAMTAAEQATLTQYIASGRRVFFLGENDSWAPWNGSFLSVVGGAAGPNLTGSPPMTPIVANALTAGVTSVTTVGAGSATGGTQLFNQNVVQLRGASNSVVSAFDYNMFSNAQWANTSNAQFGQNVATWLAAPTVVIPEPDTVALLAAGLAAVVVIARRRRAR
ncbi:MAG: PEP-CTERM sorting domain-containing protein [Gemmatimonadaceae bacterium]|jgi:hypothetical protein|nr:PEP-CTERM sorting domain-containing protein [Gemmatimonadaceae bacterium]